MTVFYLAVRGSSWMVLNSNVLIHCVQPEEYIKYLNNERRGKLTQLIPVKMKVMYLFPVDP